MLVLMIVFHQLGCNNDSIEQEEEEEEMHNISTSTIKRVMILL